MEKNDIRKIAKRFDIPELEIIQFLKELSEIREITEIKNSFLNEQSDTKKEKIFKEWLNVCRICRSFTDFEELYIHAENEKQEAKVIEYWLECCTEAKQAKEIFLCSSENNPIRNKILETWINLSNQLEEVREAKFYTKPDTKENDLAVKKIIKLFT